MHNRRIDFLKKTKYENPLPPPPFAPKVVDYELSYDRLLTAGSLSGVFLQSEVDPEVDIELGIPIDLSTCEDAFAPETAESAMCFPEVAENALDPEDLELLGEPEVSGVTTEALGNSISAGSTGIGSSRAGLVESSNEGTSSSEIGIGTSFLRRTAYMTSDTRRASKRKTANSEALSSADARKAQIDAEVVRIEQSFVDARAPLSSLKHPHKRNVTAVKSTPLLPDAKVSDLTFVEVRLLGSAALRSLEQIPSREMLASSVFLHQKTPEEVSGGAPSEWLSLFVPPSDGEAASLHKYQAELRETLSGEEAQVQEEAVWPLRKVQDADFTLLKPKQKFEEVVISHDEASNTYFYVPISSRANLRRRRVDPRIFEELRNMQLDADFLDLGVRELSPQESIERDEIRSIYDPVKFG